MTAYRDTLCRTIRYGFRAEDRRLVLERGSEPFAGLNVIPVKTSPAHSNHEIAGLWLADQIPE